MSFSYKQVLLHGTIISIGLFEKKLVAVGVTVTRHLGFTVILVAVGINIHTVVRQSYKWSMRKDNIFPGIHSLVIVYY